MSELKDYDIMDIEAMDDERLEKSESGKIQVTRVYIKSEADKVIEDLEESHKKEVEQLLIEIVKLNEGAQNLILDNYLKDKKLRHHKYKRCLAMAKWCESENYTACWYHENSERCKWTEKWHKRWLKLAENFKEAKETLELVEKANALCKEAK